MDDRDSWKVHFSDTMRGGQYVNNWRMAELHAKEAPDRVRELEAWGALFDRTKDGKILQRNFGGHRYPRLAHVGDRTGLELIRTLQDHGIHQGIDVHMECTVIRLLKDGDRVVGAFAYERERGRFKLFRAKAVVLATGGVGRAYKITSNSWEYTGDGHTLAYDAGADLLDMEFVQFHPTGMIWPPSVQGILVTEAVRGEGGVLKNSEGRRFMFDDIPDNYTAQTADNEEEGWRYTQGDKTARRPPELLTRDHVARCINREVKAGRGSPHGGVFLDIAWIKSRVPNGAEHIKKKLPSMYHQFKQLADLDITAGADGDRSDDALHHGRRAGGCRYADVDGAGAVCGRRVRRRHQRRQPARRQFALRHHRVRQARRRVRGEVRAEPGRRTASARSTWPRPLDAPSSRSTAGPSGEGAYQVQYALQDMMQSLVGIVRNEPEMQRALDGLRELARPGRARRRRRPPRVQPRLARGARPAQPADRVRGDHALRDRTQGEPRRTFPRRLSRQAAGSSQPSTSSCARRRDGGMEIVARADSRDAGGTEADHRGDEVVAPTTRDVPHLARRRHQRRVPRLPDRASPRAWSCSMPCTAIQAEQANDLAVRWNCKAGKCGSCSAEVNGKPRLMCMTRLNELDLSQPVTVEPMRAFPLIRDLVTDVSWNYQAKKSIRKFKPRPPDAADGTWRMEQADVERVQEFRKCIECFLCQDVCHVLRDHELFDDFVGPRHGVYAAALEMQPLDVEDRVRRSQGEARARLLQHHQVLHQGLPGRHHDYRQRASFR